MIVPFAWTSSPKYSAGLHCDIWQVHMHLSVFGLPWKALNREKCYLLPTWAQKRTYRCFVRSIQSKRWQVTFRAQVGNSMQQPAEKSLKVMKGFLHHCGNLPVVTKSVHIITSPVLILFTSMWHGNLRMWGWLYIPYCPEQAPIPVQAPTLHFWQFCGFSGIYV